MRCRSPGHCFNPSYARSLRSQCRIGRPHPSVQKFCYCTLHQSISHSFYTRSLHLSGLLNSTRPQFSPDQFPQTGVQTRRLQSIQAGQERDVSTEFEGEPENATELEDIDETWTPEEEPGADPSVEPINTTTGLPVCLKSSSRLIRIFRTYPLRALPAVAVHPCLSQDIEGSPDGSEPAFRLELSLDEYGISCSQILTTSTLTSHRGLVAAFEDLAHEYILRLSSFPKPSDGVPQDVKNYYIDQLLATLELDRLVIECDSVQFKNDQGQVCHLHRAQPFAGREPLGKPQLWSDPSVAERLARASAHADLMKRAEQADIDLQQIREANPNFIVAKKQRKRSLDYPRVKDLGSRVYDFSISQECYSAMLSMLHEVRYAGLPDQLAKEDRKTGATTTDQFLKPSKFELREKSRALQNREKKLPISPTAVAAWRQRESLPIRETSNSDRIWNAVQMNDVVVLVSETGSGKSTQLPQILLERAIAGGYGASCNIICTQPRRLAATSVAKRVAEERDTSIGTNVGYQVRFDQKRPQFLGSINYSTGGVILKRLQSDAETLLDEISHLIIDEVHERDLTVDILMTFVRDLMRDRKTRKKPFPKLVLMSATLKATDYEQYFAESHRDFVPQVETLTIPGRAFSVTSHMLDDIVPMIVEAYAQDKKMMTLMGDSKEYLDWEDQYADSVEQSTCTQEAKDPNTDQKETDRLVRPPSDPFRDYLIPYKLITAVVAHILRSESNGDVLIFLPGFVEIADLAETLENDLPKDLEFGNTDKIRLFRLHSQLYETNDLVFQDVPTGCRRIVLATNIAQTSITLPGVTHVIDCGKRKNNVYDQTERKHEFSSVWIDKATSLQRKGRAGRVQNGHYWAMFTEARFQSMLEQADPEMLESDLTSSALVLKSYSDTIDLQAFFAHTLDAPDASVITACIRELQEMGMLTEEEKITPFGRICSDFPLDPALARGLLLGRLFGCFIPLMITAAHPTGTPLIFSRDDVAVRMSTTMAFAGVSDDDQYAVVQAFFAYYDAVSSGSRDARRELEGMAVRGDIYRDMLRIASQLYDTLDDYGLIGRPPERRLPDHSNLLRSIPTEINALGHSMNLFKALVLTTFHTNIAVWDETERAWLAKDIKCILRPTSVNTKASRQRQLRPGPRKHGEVIGYKEMTRNVVLTPRPHLIEISNITPLVAMLFGGLIKMIDKETIEIDGWLKYKVKLAPAERGETEATEDFASPVIVILEVRKALERFIQLAFRDVKQSRPRRATWSHKRDLLFWPSHDQLGDAVRDGLLKILNADAEHWDEVIYLA